MTMTYHACSLCKVQSDLEECLVDVVIVWNLFSQSSAVYDSGTHLSVSRKLRLDELKPPVLILLYPHDVVHHLELLLEGEGEHRLHLQGEGGGNVS